MYKIFIGLLLIIAQNGYCENINNIKMFFPKYNSQPKDIVCIIIWMKVTICITDGPWEPRATECYDQYYVDEIICFDIGNGDSDGVGGTSDRDSNGNGIIDSWRQIVDTTDPCANNIKSSEDLGSNYGGINEQRPNHKGVDIQCDRGDSLYSMCTGYVSAVYWAEQMPGDPPNIIYNTTCGNGITINCGSNV